MLSTELKEKLLEESRLYAIIDKKVCSNRPLLDIATKVRDAGVKIIQFRDKESKKEVILEHAYALRNLLLNNNSCTDNCDKGRTLFIINDYLDVAKIIDSDGVHLGQDDLSIKIARKILGKHKIIGVSCHNLEQAIRAQNMDADYISIGPVFKTSTKPQNKKNIGLDIVKSVQSKIKIPFFVIGGINLKNINLALSQGVKRFAICQAICQSKNILFTIRTLNKLISL